MGGGEIEDPLFQTGERMGNKQLDLQLCIACGSTIIPSIFDSARDIAKLLAIILHPVKSWCRRKIRRIRSSRIPKPICFKKTSNCLLKTAWKCVLRMSLGTIKNSGPPPNKHILEKDIFPQITINLCSYVFVWENGYQLSISLQTWVFFCRNLGRQSRCTCTFWTHSTSKASDWLWTDGGGSTSLKRRKPWDHIESIFDL